MRSLVEGFKVYSPFYSNRMNKAFGCLIGGNPCEENLMSEKAKRAQKKRLLFKVFLNNLRSVYGQILFETIVLIHSNGFKGSLKIEKIIFFLF